MLHPKLERDLYLFFFFYCWWRFNVLWWCKSFSAPGFVSTWICSTVRIFLSFCQKCLLGKKGTSCCFCRRMCFFWISQKLILKLKNNEHNTNVCVEALFRNNYHSVACLIANILLNMGVLLSQWNLLSSWFPVSLLLKSLQQLEVKKTW